MIFGRYHPKQTCARVFLNPSHDRQVYSFYRTKYVVVNKVECVIHLRYDHDKSVFYIAHIRWYVPIFLFHNRNNQKIWNFHNELFTLKCVPVQSFKSKFATQLFWCSWEVHDIVLKNTVKMRYFGTNIMAARTLSRVSSV
jgi:hypothetical protein